MITSETIYWITRLDAIKDLLGGAVFVCFFLLVLCVGGFGMASNELEEHPIVRALLAMGVLIGLLGAPAAGIAHTFIPSSKEYAAMLVVPRIANSETVQEMGGQVVDLARERLEALKPEKKEGK